MDPEPEPTSEKDASQETPPADRPKRPGGRASMRDEFLALFRDTRLPPPSKQALPEATVSGGERVPTASEPSRFLRKFLQQATPSPEPAQSGLAGLDLCLGGGFGPGLHLVLGPPRSGKTAFLDALAWEAVASRRPSLYYALKGGSMRVWERLIATLGTILDGPAVTPAALRGQELIPGDRETLTRLDDALQTTVLPYLSLVDATPATTGSLSAFIEDVRSRGQETGEQHGRLPLVLVDDLERLLTLTGSRSTTHLLTRLNDILRADSIPGLLAGGPEGVLPVGMERLNVQTVLILTPALPSAAGVAERVDVEIQKNKATGWTGSLSLVLDPSSGLFAEAGPSE
jgi:hypothetical protein